MGRNVRGTEPHALYKEGVRRSLHINIRDRLAIFSGGSFPTRFVSIARSHGGGGGLMT
jgi:hypothetical protein